MPPQGSAPQKYVEHLSEHGYHPRSSKHGDILCILFLQDLLETCPLVRELAAAGKIVYRLNHTISKGTPDEWTMDLVIGPPEGRSKPSTHGFDGIREGTPSDLWLLMDAKGIMTEHGKARRNRARDVTALHDRMHASHPKAVVGALIAVNTSGTFRSPLREETTIHKNIERLVEETVELFEGVPLAELRPGKRGLEGMGIIVVDHANVDGSPATLVAGPPGPSAESPVAYANFLSRMCRTFVARYRTQS